MTTQMEMPKYVSHKTVWALKIKSIASAEVTVLTFDNPAYAPKIVSEAYEHKHNPEAGGYYVVYADGYESYSPAKAFEEGYTPLDAV